MHDLVTIDTDVIDARFNYETKSAVHYPADQALYHAVPVVCSVVGNVLLDWLSLEWNLNFE